MACGACVAGGAGGACGASDRPRQLTPEVGDIWGSSVEGSDAVHAVPAVPAVHAMHAFYGRRVLKGIIASDWADVRPSRWGTRRYQGISGDQQLG